jgi:hypothetical protein
VTMRIFRMIGKACLPIAALLLWTTLTGCGDLFGEHTLSSGPVDGIVVDKVTQKPIAGAIVVGEWSGDRGGPVQSSTVSYHVETAVSNKLGRFAFKAWTIPNIGDSMSRIRNPSILFWSYAIGYDFGLPADTQTHKIEMLPYGGTKAERFKLLFRYSAQSGGEFDNSIKHLIPLRLAVLREARQIAETAEERHTADQIEWHLSYLCAIPPGQGVEKDRINSPRPFPQLTWPPAPCTDQQLQER